MFDLTITTFTHSQKFTDVEGVNLPTPDGRRGILPNHMPIMTPLDIGVITIRQDGREKKYTITDGIFYFENNEATIMTSAFEDVENIDIERAMAAQQKALERLAAGGKDSDIERAHIALAKAINRIKAYNER